MLSDSFSHLGYDPLCWFCHSGKLQSFPMILSRRQVTFLPDDSVMNLNYTSIIEGVQSFHVLHFFDRRSCDFLDRFQTITRCDAIARCRIMGHDSFQRMKHGNMLTDHPRLTV